MICVHTPQAPEQRIRMYALIVTNLDAISDGIADSYLKIGAVREAGFRLFSVDEKEPKVDLYIPPKRGDLSEDKEKYDCVG